MQINQPRWRRVARRQHRSRQALPMGIALTVTGRGANATSSVALLRSTSTAPPAPTSVDPHGGAPIPVWLSALLATPCQARSLGMDREIRWHPVAGRALYTNPGGQAERIEPLGVTLPAGNTLAVYWSPGETGYTLEVFSSTERCA
jgi:hypothetical protein